MFHSVVGVVLPEAPIRAAHQDVAPQQPWERRFAEDRDGQVRQRTQRHERDLAGPPARLVEDHVDGVSLGQRP